MAALLKGLAMEHILRSGRTLSDEALQRIDPLGQIRAFAMELWEREGKSCSKSWEDFFEQAEEALLSGSGNEAFSQNTSIRARSTISPNTTPPIPVEQLSHLSDCDALSAIVAGAAKNFLSSHEGVCLARIFEEHKMVLADGRTIGPLTPDTIAPILANLVHVIERDDRSIPFLQKLGKNDASELSLSERAQYWHERLIDAIRRDEPLNYAQQNTIRRLIETLYAHPQMRSLQFVEDAE